MAPESEAPLPAIIQPQLPIDTKQQLATLSEKRSAETLTKSEYAELLQHTEQVEDLNRNHKIFCVSG